MIEGRLVLNNANNRYGLFGTDSFEHEGFHCGEVMEVLYHRKWIQTRIEMDWTAQGQFWYLVGTPYYGNLENVIARIT